MQSRVAKKAVVAEKEEQEVIRMQITFNKNMWRRLRAMTKAKTLTNEQELIRLGMSQMLDAAGF